jgi:hypothetical protein
MTTWSTLVFVRDFIKKVADTLPTAGQMLVAASSTTLAWQTQAWITITKTATEARASTTTLADDAILKFPMAANTTYRFRATIVINVGDLNADVKYQWNGPASPTKISILCTHAAVGAAPANQVVDTSYAATASGTLDGSSGDVIVKAEGTIQNGANAGDFAFQWAQASSNVTATNVLKGSYIEYAAVP